ncbi:MAG: hypothetical protein ACI4RP_09495 [Acutalibacteraceae bacterium]
MEKEKYIKAEMQITEFETEDIITTSRPELEENELDIIEPEVVGE